jgi:hypothetical protein
MKSRRRKQAWHVACMEHMQNAYNIFVASLKERITLKSREDVKIFLKQIR